MAEIEPGRYSFSPMMVAILDGVHAAVGGGEAEVTEAHPQDEGALLVRREDLGRFLQDKNLLIESMYFTEPCGPMDNVIWTA